MSTPSKHYREVLNLLPAPLHELKKLTGLSNRELMNVLYRMDAQGIITLGQDPLQLKRGPCA